MSTSTRRGRTTARYGRGQYPAQTRDITTVNKFLAPCTRCGCDVPTGTGYAIKPVDTGKWETRHQEPRKVDGRTVGGCPIDVDLAEVLGQDPPAFDRHMVRQTVDTMGRDIIVIPDVVAVRIYAETKKGWREFRGHADGESRKFGKGTWMYDATSLIMIEYAANPPSRDEYDHRDPDDARGDVERSARYRKGTLQHGHMAGCAFIVGESGWNFDAHWWRDHGTTRHLHPNGFPYLTDNGTAVQYGG
jgi:hypothetical protein